MKLKLLLASILCLSLGVHHSASAHDPALHGFSLVTFEKPFAAPAFDLETLSGGSTSLDDFRGKYVLVNFWATWCPPCLEEMPSLNALHARLAERGFTVAAISSDEEGQAIVQPFIDSLGVDFPVLLDPDKTVSLSYGAKNLPMTFLLNPDGEVIAAAQGERDWASKEAFSTFDELVQP